MSALYSVSLLVRASVLVGQQAALNSVLPAETRAPDAHDGRDALGARYAYGYGVRSLLARDVSYLFGAVDHNCICRLAEAHLHGLVGRLVPDAQLEHEV